MIFGNKFKKNNNTPSKSIDQLIKDASDIIDLRLKVMNISCKYYDKLLALYNSMNNKNIQDVYNQFVDIDSKGQDEVNEFCNDIKSKDNDINDGIKFYMNDDFEANKQKFSKLLDKIKKANSDADKINKKYGGNFSSSDDAYYYTEDKFMKNSKVSKIDNRIGEKSAITLQEWAFLIATNIENIASDFEYYSGLNN